MNEDIKIILKTLKSRFELLSLCLAREDVKDSLNSFLGAVELTKLDLAELEKMLSEIDVGYSPENLKSLRLKGDLTQKNVADMLNVSVRTVMRWEKPLNSSEHSDMPYSLWRQFYSAVGNVKNLDDCELTFDLKTNLYGLKRLGNSNKFDVFKNHYGMNLITPYGCVELSDDLINGLKNKPSSGYFCEKVNDLISRNTV